MQSTIYKATISSFIFITALQGITQRSYTPVYTDSDALPVVVSPTLVPSQQSSLVDVDDVVNLPSDIKPGTVVIVVDKKEKKEEYTPAQTAKDLLVSIALIAAVTYATDKVLENSFPEKNWKRTTAENIQKAVVGGIGLVWINECAKTNFGKVRNWFSAAVDKAVDLVQDAAESAKEKTSSAKKVVVKAFRINR